MSYLAVSLQIESADKRSHVGILQILVLLNEKNKFRSLWDSIEYIFYGEGQQWILLDSKLDLYVCIPMYAWLSINVGKIQYAVNRSFI